MSSNYGVNTVVSTNAARPVTINSSTPIGIVGTALLDGTEGDLYDKVTAGEPLFFGSATKALEAFKEKDGTIREALDGIEDQNVTCPLVIQVVQITESQASRGGAETFYDEPAIKSAVIENINKLKKAHAITTYKPNIIIAPRFSHDLDVSTEMISVAHSLLGMSIIDLNVADEAAAILARESYGTSRALLRDPYVKVWDTGANKSVYQPDSARVAGIISATDGAREYGWADSFSSRVMLGISGPHRAIEFAAGKECEADRLRSEKIGTIIRYNGFRTWGGETTDIDPIWQDHTRVRVFDRISVAGISSFFWAIDRRATDVLKPVKDSVEQMCLALKGAGVLIGYEVWWDSELNTRANITAGKFYLVAQMQNSPIVKRLEINFQYADRWGDTLIKMIA